MNPSSARMRAISRFTLDEGSVSSLWRAALALRMRVSMSAIGSVTFIVLGSVSSAVVRSRRVRVTPAADGADRREAAAGVRCGPGLPARLGHARKQPIEGALPEADTAHREAPHVAARAAADLTAVVLPDPEARCALRPRDG